MEELRGLISRDTKFWQNEDIMCINSLFFADTLFLADSLFFADSLFNKVSARNKLSEKNKLSAQMYYSYVEK